MKSSCRIDRDYPRQSNSLVTISERRSRAIVARPLRLIRRVAELVPDSEILAQLGRAAVLFNHPRYAVEVLERLDPEAGWMPSWTPYWRRLTEAYHLLGDHRSESAAAQRSRRQHPESVAALLYEARAFAALGDVDATRLIVDEALGRGSDPFATAGEVLFVAARELKSHENATAGAAILDRAIEWQRDACVAECESFATHMTLARMQYDAERFSEASTTLAAWRPVHASDVDVIGLTGSIAAREGDGVGRRISNGGTPSEDRSLPLRKAFAVVRANRRRTWRRDGGCQAFCAARLLADAAMTSICIQMSTCRSSQHTRGIRSCYDPKAERS
jgi:hypothetical protein